MNTSMKSKTSKDIIDFIKENIALFRCFENVYLFGSILDVERIPNDIDILLIYAKYTDVMKDELKNIAALLEKVCGLPVDLTVLSVDERKNTGFLQRIDSKCLKLK